MTRSKRIVFSVIAGLIVFGGLEVGEQLSIPGIQGVIPTTEARVGRPLTPVSVAGVARRSVRRCAVGVYNCSLPGSGSVDSLLGQISAEPIRFPG